MTGSGAMATPSDIWNVGWYAAGPRPGARGDAVIDGHLGLPGAALVFASLGRIRAGDLIVVVGDDGARRNFAVTGVSTWAAAARPPGLFATDGEPRLSLVTCTGAYLPALRSYAERIVVDASPAG